MQHSFIFSGIKAFFVTFFTIVGICLAVIPLIFLISFLITEVEEEPESHFSLEILSNADGVRKSLSSEDPVILSIPIKGVIGVEDLTKDTIRKMLIESREDILKHNRVKGLFLVIESPGGTVVDADGIYHAIKEYKTKYNVPVYAFVDGLCASGGMYVAACADKIFASEVSLIGSVGVIAPSFLNLTQLMEKIGVQSLTLYAGKGKDDLNPLRPWKPGEEKPLQDIIDFYYNMFLDIVTSNRTRLKKETLVADLGAHVYPAEKATEYGYIDAHGLSRNEALKLLLQKMGIENDKYQVVELTSKTWFNTLFKSKTSLLSGKIQHEFNIAPNLHKDLQGKFLYLYTGSNK